MPCGAVLLKHLNISAKLNNVDLFVLNSAELRNLILIHSIFSRKTDLILIIIMSERSEYRRPPSDVDNMVSLRVDNLPYRTHPEVQRGSPTLVSISHC